MSRILVAASIAIAAILTASSSLAAPTGPIKSPHHLPISRRSPGFQGLYGDDLIAWTESNTARLRTKYASKLQSSTAKQSSKRSSKRDTEGSASLVNYENDSLFYTTVDVGTPSQSVTVILDTGSSDFWLIQGRNRWSPSQSSSFVNTTTAFAISYGSGSVRGVLATDTVTLASHTASSQTFAIATAVTSNLLSNDLDGIMGFGFKSLSTSGATPFWQSSGADQFAFYLKESSTSTGTTTPNSPNGPDSFLAQTSDGGIFTLGGTNTSLYQGDINYSPVIDEAYWLITLGGITIGSNTVNLSSMNKMAVDTGTTLIGAPDSVVEAIYSQIDGSSTLSSSSTYYQFPCSTTVNTTIHLGDQEYSLSGDNFKAGTVDSTGEYCLGAFFGLGSDSNDELQYILGDAFLTQVYTIFDNTQTTARVGFANLAEGLGATTQSITVDKVVVASASSPRVSIACSAIGIVILSTLYQIFA